MNRTAVNSIIRQNFFNIFNELSIMRPISIQPEYSRRPDGLLPRHTKPDPVFDGRRFGCCHTPDIAFAHLMLMQHITGRAQHLHDACLRHFKGCRVRPIFFGFLCHQSDIRYGATCGRIKRAIDLEKANGLIINRRIGIIRDHTFAIILIAIRPPGTPASTD